MRDQTAADIRWMSRALELAERGPAADPNPRVGCVVVQGDSLVGAGWHRGAGTPHAETMALAEAGARATGATAYVTLEPCTHVGRTPPCADALLASGVRRVVIGARDPSERAGGGRERLVDHGVQVEGGVLADRSRDLNRPWEHAVRLARPFVTWKVAATLDGRVAAADGSSRWITGEQARAEVHRLRAHVGAILVGTGTVLADDPALTVRGDAASERTSPVRVVMGRTELPPEARVRDADAPTLLCRTHDPAEALGSLHAREIRHVLLEGGPTLAAAFLRAGYVDRIVAYFAPALLGAGPSLLGDLGIRTIGDAVRWSIRSVDLVGSDARLILEPTRSTACSRA